MQMLRLLFVSTVLAALALAADVTGTWKAQITAPDGQTRQHTYNLKADGEKLTGTLVTGRGEEQIQDGTIKGDDVSFTVVRNFGGQEVPFKYTGKVSGNTMKLHVVAGDREMDVTATKQ